MIQIDYENPRQIERPPRSRFWPYFAGAAAVVLGGFIAWMILLEIWPDGRWQILEPPDMFGCAVIGGVIEMSISAGIYARFASRTQSTGRHFNLGVAAGGLHFAATNFVQRLSDNGAAPQAILGTIYFSSYLALPALLGLLSRHYASEMPQKRT